MPDTLDLLPYLLVFNWLLIVGLVGLCLYLWRQLKGRPQPASNGQRVRPWFRFFLSLGVLVTYAVVTFRLLGQVTGDISPLLAALISMLLQGLITTAAMIFAWWFKQDTDEQPNTTDDHPYPTKPPPTERLPHDL